MKEIIRPLIKPLRKYLAIAAVVGIAGAYAGTHFAKGYIRVDLMVTIAIFGIVLIFFAFWLEYLVLPRKLYRIKTPVKIEAPNFWENTFNGGRYHFYAKVVSFEMEKREELVFSEHVIDVWETRQNCPDLLDKFLSLVNERIAQERALIYRHWEANRETPEPPKLLIDRSYRNTIPEKLAAAEQVAS